MSTWSRFAYRLGARDQKEAEPLGYTVDMKREMDISRRKVLLGAGAFAAVFAIVLCAVQASGVFPEPEPTPFLNRRSSSNYMIALGPLAVIWGFSIYIRCSDAKIRRYLIEVATLVVFWMLVALVKYQADSDLATSLLWYCYYIPMVIIPALCLFCALRAATLDETPTARAAMRAIAVASVALIALVLTNNLHHFVFSFDFADANWSGNYRYAFGYYLIDAWQALLFAAFFVTLFIAARSQLKMMLIPVAVIASAGIVISVLYALRFIAMVSLNFSLSYCILVIAALEITFDTGLFPSYLWYADAFRKLPFALEILDENNGVVFQTEQASRQPLQTARILDCSGKPESKSEAFRTACAPHTLFKVYPVSGGRALLAEDASDIDKRREMLEKQRDYLRRSNAVLSREADVQREACRLRNERELFADIEASLKNESLRIKDLIDNLPREDTPEAAAKRREMLIEAKLLVAYCKRKGSLVISEKSDPEFDRARLQLVFNETASDLRSIGIDCAAFVQTERPLPSCVVSALYDCLYDFAIAANSCNDAVLMLHVRENDGYAELRAMLSARSLESASAKSMLADLEANLAKRDSSHIIEQTDQNISAITRIPIPRGSL